MSSSQVKSSYICYGKVAVAGQSLRWDDFWIQVRGFWLEISKKIGNPCYFVIPLDLASLTGGFQETNVQNSIALLTSPVTGSHKIYLQTTNRNDIIQLYHAIQNGRTALMYALQNNKLIQKTEFECETVAAFFNIGKSKLKLHASIKGFEFTGNKASTKYPINKIHAVFAKMNDSSADTRLCLTVDENGSTSTKEFNCISHQNLVYALSCFLSNVYLGQPE